MSGIDSVVNVLRSAGGEKHRAVMVFTHHLTQPPQQEAHADIRGAREVELVAQSGREDEIIHVWRRSDAQGGEKNKCFFIIQFILFDAKMCVCICVPLRVRLPG